MPIILILLIPALCPLRIVNQEYTESPEFLRKTPSLLFLESTFHTGSFTCRIATISIEEDGSGNRALHYAVRWGHAELASILLDAHAEIGVKNKAESTTLELA